MSKFKRSYIQQQIKQFLSLLFVIVQQNYIFRCRVYAAATGYATSNLTHMFLAVEKIAVPRGNLQKEPANSIIIKPGPSWCCAPTASK